MKYPAGKPDWLDEMLREVLHTANAGPDFEKWKREHPEVVKGLLSMNSTTNGQYTDREAQP
jgi:hypothetical protein